MEKTFAELEGAILRYVGDRDAVDRAPLRDALNEAYQELYERARDAEVDGIEATDRMDLVGDQAVYKLPDHITDLKGVARLDLATEMVPLTPVPYRQMYRAYRADRRGYVLLPGGRQFRLLQAPSATLDDGLVLWHLPRAVRLRKPDDVPLLPPETHEAIVGNALARVRAWATLKAPKEAEAYMAMTQQRFARFLEPDGRAAPNSLVPSFPFHIPQRRRPF